MKYVVSFETWGIAVRGPYVRETDKVVYYLAGGPFVDSPMRERRTSKDESLYVIESDLPIAQLSDEFTEVWRMRSVAVRQAQAILDDTIKTRLASAMTAVKVRCSSFTRSEARQ